MIRVVIFTNRAIEVQHVQIWHVICWHLKILFWYISRAQKSNREALRYIHICAHKVDVVIIWSKKFKKGRRNELIDCEYCDRIFHPGEFDSPSKSCVFHVHQVRTCCRGSKQVFIEVRYLLKYVNKWCLHIVPDDEGLLVLCPKYFSNVVEDKILMNPERR